MNSPFEYLTEQQKESLKGLPFRVLLPSELPLGWSVEEVDVSEVEDGMSSAVTIKTATGKLNFLATNEGIGDPPGGARTTVHYHPDFGSIKVEFEDDGAFLCDWVEVEGGFGAVGGHDVDDGEIETAVTSLAVY